MNKSKLWIWENENYPNFVYDKKKIDKLLLDIAKQQGLLEGTIKHLSQDEQNTIFTENLLDEIIFNSSIEGEILQWKFHKHSSTSFTFHLPLISQTAFHPFHFLPSIF